MPIYEYKCKNCDEIFEELVVSNSTPDSKISCPKCGKNKAEKLISATAIGGFFGSSVSNDTSGGSCGSGGFT